MAMSMNNEHFTTKIKGTVGNILTSPKIILYNSRFITERISISNIDFVVSLIKSSDYYREIIKTEDTFIYNRLDIGNKLVDIGFDTIVYISTENLPVGFTEFNKIFGLLSNELNINVSINSDEIEKDNNSPINIDIFNNSLSQIIEYSSSIKSLISNESYGFTSAKKINEDIKTRKDIYPRYINHINGLEKQPKSNILLSNGFCNLSGLYRLDLIKEMLVTDNFENYQLGYYKGEIVLYMWNNFNGNDDIVYSIYSLSRKDRFGKPMCYTNTSTNKGYIRKNPQEDSTADNKITTSRSKAYTGKNKNGEIVNMVGQVRTETTVKIKKNYKKILYTSGKFLSVLVDIITTTTINSYGKEKGASWEDKNRRIYLVENETKQTKSETKEIYNFESQNWVNIDESFTYTMDIWKTSSTIHEIPEILSKARFINLFPNILNTNLNIHTYNENISLLKIVGEWFVLELERLDLLIFTNITKTVYISKTDDKDAIPINNDILLLKTKTDDNIVLNYFVGDGVFYSENAIKSIYNIEYIGNDNIELIKEKVLCNGRVETCYINSEKEIIPDHLNNKDNYESGKIISEIVGDNIIESYTLGFKRNVMNKTTIPNIIGSLCGLIYEKEDNLIRYF